MLILQLVVGDFGLSYEESKAQFALWAILASVSIGFFFILQKQSNELLFEGDMMAQFKFI